MVVASNSRFHVFCPRCTGLLLEKEETQDPKSKSPWKGRGWLQMTTEPAQSLLKSKKISNDQELIQSDPTFELLQ